MENHILSVIGDGGGTHLWLDKWHPHGVLIKKYGK